MHVGFQGQVYEKVAAECSFAHNPPERNEAVYCSISASTRIDYRQKEMRRVLRRVADSLRGLDEIRFQLVMAAGIEVAGKVREPGRSDLRARAIPLLERYAGAPDIYRVFIVIPAVGREGWCALRQAGKAVRRSSQAAMHIVQKASVYRYSCPRHHCLPNSRRETAFVSGPAPPSS